MPTPSPRGRRLSAYVSAAVFCAASLTTASGQTYEPHDLTLPGRLTLAPDLGMLTGPVATLELTPEPSVVDVELTVSPTEPDRTIVGFYPFDTRRIDLPFEFDIDTGTIGGPSASASCSRTCNRSPLAVTKRPFGG